ncbi:hypothetical protein [Cellulosilyticum sp. I15G10I2]|uniref:hypothetical protein n=1 Tax=Cellulosilyticum sp. I15G10I2 TaxID=1892843 RepID=UPI00085C63D8|nr:hypothetical protein [Cellulosilyticum sp. I15G10I2]
MKKTIKVGNTEVANQVVSMEYLLDIAIKKVERAIEQSSIGEEMEYLVSRMTKDDTFAGITIQPKGLYEMVELADETLINNDNNLTLRENMDAYQLDLCLTDLLNLNSKDITYKISNLYLAYKNSLFFQYPVGLECKDIATLQYDEKSESFKHVSVGIVTIYDGYLQIIESYNEVDGSNKEIYPVKHEYVKSSDMSGKYEWKLVTA